MIKVPRSKWLAYLLAEHSAKTRDIGDQRDPIIIIACKCGAQDKVRYSSDVMNLYAKHLQEVLEQEYFNRIEDRYYTGQYGDH